MTALAIPDQLDSRVDDMVWIWRPLLATLALQLFSWEYLLLLTVIRQSDDRKATLAAILALYARAGMIRRAWARRMEPLLLDIYRRAGEGLPEAPSAAALARAVQARANDLATNVTQRTASDVRDALTGAVTDAEGAVRSIFSPTGLTERSRRIGQVEATYAASEGEFLAASASGYEVCTWRHDGLPRLPREQHIVMDGFTVPLGEEFPGIGCRYPRDWRGPISQTANCTCSARFGMAH